ncbi:TerB family tellurite resistance protein [Rhodoflexus caldus]|uniref:TerB family tellurite resistance protein n=1 Tax=Rhodoflexus caldus TaxID=2891236 RepID=UPI00202A9231|nr:TerB family tellurite resistance protein [Rhodoflexus caldus]
MNKESIFENLIALATADGQLSPDEQKMLQKKAAELGLNYNDYAAQIQAALAGTPAETQIIDREKQKGDDFEKYIVRKFDKKYFTLLEWSSDKYTAGVYAKNIFHLDLKLQFKLNNTVKVFAVECKYRSGYYKNGIEWCKIHQFNGYKKFAMETRIPVFVALGVGGTADNPEDLYILPLEKVSDIFLTKEVLFPFKKFKPQERNLFFDLQKEVLK